MSRVIKFRIMDKRTGFYIKGVDEKCFNVPYLDVSALREYLIWEQFTGLLDSTGREIYEGDIIEYPQDTPSVHRHNPRFDRSVVEYRTDGINELRAGWFVGGDYADTETTKVIGNIHENPDLLNKRTYTL